MCVNVFGSSLSCCNCIAAAAVPVGNCIAMVVHEYRDCHCTHMQWNIRLWFRTNAHYVLRSGHRMHRPRSVCPVHSCTHVTRCCSSATAKMCSSLSLQFSFLSFNVSLWIEKPTLIAIVTAKREREAVECTRMDMIAIVIVMCGNVCAWLSLLLRDTILCPWLSAILCPLGFKLLRKDFCSSFRRQPRLLQTQFAHLHVVLSCQQINV